MKRWQLAALVVAAAALGLWASAVPMFPDPKGSEESVTFLKWVYREVEKLLSGEKEAL